MGSGKYCSMCGFFRHCLSSPHWWPDIPFHIQNPHESSTCSIPRNSNLAELISEKELVIWDEAPMQHRHIHEAVNKTFATQINHLEAYVWFLEKISSKYCLSLSKAHFLRLLTPVSRNLIYDALSKFSSSQRI